MANVIFESDRQFQVWRWDVGHSQLVLRSNPTVDTSSRIEILFKPAAAVSLPATLRGLRIALLDQAPAVVTNLCGDLDSQRDGAFSIATGSRQGFVVAGSVHGRSDFSDYAAPSMFNGFTLEAGVTELFSVSAPFI